jgi:hypothetical protein
MDIFSRGEAVDPFHFSRILHGGRKDCFLFIPVFRFLCRAAGEMGWKTYDGRENRKPATS